MSYSSHKTLFWDLEAHITVIQLSLHNRRCLEYSTDALSWHRSSWREYADRHLLYTNTKSWVNEGLDVFVNLYIGIGFYLIMVKGFIFKLHSNTIMTKGVIFIFCLNMIMEKGLNSNEILGAKVVWFHIWHSQLLWILLATIISRQLCQLFLLWILLAKVIFSNSSEYPKVIFLQLRKNFQTFPLVIQRVLSFF